MSAQRVNGTPEPEHQPAGETPAVGIAELELPPGSDVRQAQERVVEELLGRPPSMAIEEEIGALRRVLASEDLGRLGEHLRELEERLKSEEAKREETADFVGRLSQMATRAGRSWWTCGSTSCGRWWASARRSASAWRCWWP